MDLLSTYKIPCGWAITYLLRHEELISCETLPEEAESDRCCILFPANPTGEWISANSVCPGYWVTTGSSRSSLGTAFEGSGEAAFW